MAEAALREAIVVCLGGAITPRSSCRTPPAFALQPMSAIDRLSSLSCSELRDRFPCSGPSRWAAPGIMLSMLMAVVLLAGCERPLSMREAFRDRTPHDRYATALRNGDLAETALGRSWLAAANRALQEPLTATPPFREIGYFDPAQPSAIGYRVTALRGQRVRIRIRSALPDSARLFSDLFEMPADTTRSPTHVAHADTAGAITVEAQAKATYLLRLQPELLRGGRYMLTIQVGASLAMFPVSGFDTRAVRSVFGDPRDGGRRKHHGIDIFAPRGTPVVAATEGIVRRVGNGGLGGKTVWLRDMRGRSFYYAHLDSQLVRSGQRVQPGDTLGLVGNTGNARTTPPHLHFGLYQRGPIDPYPFVHEPSDPLPPVAADTSCFGCWHRVASVRANLRTGPTTDTPVRRQLSQHTALRLTGSSGVWHRVRLPDGTDGFIAASLLRSTEPALRSASFAQAPVLHRPTFASAVTDSLGGEAVDVRGQFRDFLLIDRPGGRAGWVQAESG